MKKFILPIATIAAVAALVFLFPRKSSVLRLIDLRESSREFSTAPLDDKTTGAILWAAFGTNSRGTRTIATSKNEQNLKVYAVRADGAFLFEDGSLTKVVEGDLRPLFARQDFVSNAPLTLLFAGTDRRVSPLHAGSAYQNVSLYCAEKGLAQVVRAYYDAEAVEKALGMKKGEFSIISQTIGFKK
ncbi:MAG: nitroreductase family protein [Rickettsiales bacterium]|jgi:hypothetical protein|nr:nitroreductase family protein [Rickettsiales bacterium]